MMIAMDDASETASGPTGTLTVECSPGPVDAGGTLTLAASVTTAPPADLRDGALVLRDAAGATLCTAAFTEFDGLTSGTGPFTVPAPTAPGRYAWVATAPLDADGAAELEAAFEVEVRAHAMSLLVWDVPATVVAGERFRFKVGSKCSSGCALGGRSVEIDDAEGAQVTAVALSAEPGRRPRSMPRRSRSRRRPRRGCSGGRRGRRRPTRRRRMPRGSRPSRCGSCRSPTSW